MRKLIRRATLGIALVGIGLGGAGIVFAPSTAVTTEADIHADEDWNCVSGCEIGEQICCGEQTPE